ncbi:MAG: metal-dependent transcriptional regulator [Desulfobacterales bacterium]|nr:metal-dependent transcriptional regulator [Desulfobacterales bacterium]
MNLTPSQENYLVHIWRLADKDAVRVADLANAVGVKRPSVTRAVNNLAGMGLVRHEHYGTIEFTAEGRRAAGYIARRNTILKRFLTQVLQLDAGRAVEEVCRMEHAIGDEVLRRLDRLSDFIDTHGALHKKLGGEMRRRTKPGKNVRPFVIGSKPHV